MRLSRTQMEAYKELRKTLGLPHSAPYIKRVTAFYPVDLNEREQMTLIKDLGFDKSDYFTFKAEGGI